MKLTRESLSPFFVVRYHADERESTSTNIRTSFIGNRLKYWRSTRMERLSDDWQQMIMVMVMVMMGPSQTTQRTLLNCRIWTCCHQAVTRTWTVRRFLLLPRMFCWRTGTYDMLRRWSARRTHSFSYTHTRTHTHSLYMYISRTLSQWPIMGSLLLARLLDGNHPGDLVKSGTPRRPGHFKLPPVNGSEAPAHTMMIMILVIRRRPRRAES